MKTQFEVARKYVLDRLENGTFSAGMRLPGSCKLSKELNISAPIVKNAMNVLVNEGILKAEPRSGLYVKENWKYRQVQGTIRIFLPENELQWTKMFKTEMNRQLPQLHFTTVFRECPFEIITTPMAQSRHEDFIDLMPLLKENYPNMGPFYSELLRPFIYKGKLTALPFLFSPRIIMCNRKMLAEANCPEPKSDWTLDDLMKLAARLRKHFPAEKVFWWKNNRAFWMNFILACGGQLYDPESEDPVKFDSPEVLKGLKYYRKLRFGEKITVPAFCGESAIAIIDRQIYGLIRGQQEKDWLFLPMPGDTQERTGISIQATELFAIRHNGVDHELGGAIIRFLWSKEFQDHIAELCCGIPIRKSSTQKIFTKRIPAEIVFEKACRQICSSYQLYNPALQSLITNGIIDLLDGDEDLERGIKDLAYVVRRYIKYMRIS